MNVIKPSIPMRSKPKETSSLETECLFGETITILDTYLDWYYCKLLTDSYCGWVQKKFLGEIIKSSHRIVSNRSYLFKDNDIKLGYVNYLPLGSQIYVSDFDDFWAKVYLGNNTNQKFAYIPRKHLIKNEDKIDDWVITAEKLIGTPYVWGGRDSMGLDCSALLQLSYQTYGENIPRNSSDQSLLNKETGFQINEILKKTRKNSGSVTRRDFEIIYQSGIERTVDLTITFSEKKNLIFQNTKLLF